MEDRNLGDHARSVVTFQDGRNPGLFIGAVKLAQDAANFRTCAGFLKTISSEPARNCGVMLESLASMWEQAAQGLPPQAPAMSPGGVITASAPPPRKDYPEA